MSVDGWARLRLGATLALEYGSALRADARSGSGYPVYGSSGEVGRHAEFTVEGPGIVVGRKGTVGSVTWSNENFWPIDTAYYVSPLLRLDLRWLYWRLSTTPLDTLDSSTGVPGLNRNDAYELQLDLPPLPEQRRIAEILDTLDEAIRKAEQVIAKLQQVKQGLLHDLLTRGLDDNGELRDPDRYPEQFKDSPLGRIPKAWDVRTVGRVCTLQRGLDLPVQERKGGTVPVFGANGIDGWHDRSPLKGPGVITGRSGSIGLVRFCEHTYWPLNTTLYVKDFHENDPKWVVLLLTSLRLWRFSAATSVPSLNRNFVHPEIVAVPPPTEQRRIQRLVTEAQRRIDSERADVSKLRTLKQGLMDDLLTGRVRVKVPEECV